MLLFACNTTLATVTIAKARPRDIVLILGKKVINVYVSRLLVSKERERRERGGEGGCCEMYSIDLGMRI